MDLSKYMATIAIKSMPEDQIPIHIYRFFIRDLPQKDNIKDEVNTFVTDQLKLLKKHSILSYRILSQYY